MTGRKHVSYAGCILLLELVAGVICFVKFQQAAHLWLVYLSIGMNISINSTHCRNLWAIRGHRRI